MKYAFIVLIACYLVVYGCSPDSSEKTSTSHETGQAAIEQQHHNTDADIQSAPPDQPIQIQDQQAENTSIGHLEAAVTKQPQTEEQPQGETVVLVEEINEPAQTLPPCARVLERTSQVKTPPAPVISKQEAKTAVAIERMIQATNDMVMVTRQLVSATQAMIDATQGVTAEATVDQQQQQQPQN